MSRVIWVAVAVLAIVIVAALMMAVCMTRGDGPPATEVPGPKVLELVVWTNEVAAMEQTPEGAGQYGLYLKEQFEKEHPGVVVVMEDHGWDEELRQELSKALLAGTAPDVVVGENYFQQFARQGALLALDTRIADIKDNLIESTYRAAVYDGYTYGLSASTGVFGFERNCQVIEQAGLDCNTPPKTWDELLTQARTITEKGEGDYYGYTLQGTKGFSVGGIFRIAVYLAQADASMCEANCTYPFFNDPRAVPVMEFLRELHRYTPPGLSQSSDENQIYSQLYQGRSAYQIAGSWHVNQARQSGCADCRYSAIPIPEDGHSASIIVGNVIYAVTSQSKQPDLAVEWIRFLVRDDVQALINPTVGRLPSTRSGLEALRTTADIATQSYINELLQDPNLGILPQWQKYPQQLWNIYNEMLTRVLYTEEPIEQIMNDAQMAADRVMQK